MRKTEHRQIQVWGNGEKMGKLESLRKTRQGERKEEKHIGEGAWVELEQEATVRVAIANLFCWQINTNHELLGSLINRTN